MPHVDVRVLKAGRRGGDGTRVADASQSCEGGLPHARVWMAQPRGHRGDRARVPPLRDLGQGLHGGPPDRGVLVLQVHRHRRDRLRVPRRDLRERHEGRPPHVREGVLQHRGHGRSSLPRRDPPERLRGP